MSDTEDIKTLIDKRIKIVLDGIDMLHEEMLSIKREIKWLYYFVIVLFVIIFIVGISGFD